MLLLHKLPLHTQEMPAWMCDMATEVGMGRKAGSPEDWVSLGSHGPSREKGLTHMGLGKGDIFSVEPIETMAIS